MYCGVLSQQLMGLEVETQPLNDGWACRADIVVIIVLVIIYIVHYDIVIIMVITKYHCFVLRYHGQDYAVVHSVSGHSSDGSSAGIPWMASIHMHRYAALATT